MFQIQKHATVVKMQKLKASILSIWEVMCYAVIEMKDIHSGNLQEIIGSMVALNDSYCAVPQFVLYPSWS